MLRIMRNVEVFWPLRYNLRFRLQELKHLDIDIEAGIWVLRPKVQKGEEKEKKVPYVKKKKVSQASLRSLPNK